jgi:hypothetical protein
MMRKIQSIAILLIILLSSCHLEDFKIDKLSVTSKPAIYAPLAYGTFKVKDYLPYMGADDQVVYYPEIELTQFKWNKGEVSFSSDAIDSTYLIMTYTNGSPMKMQVQFTFIDYSTGTVSGRPFDSGILPSGTVTGAANNAGELVNVTKPSVTTVKYLLDSNDLQTIKTTDGVKCIVKLIDSGNTVTVRNLKESEIKMQINFKTDVLLGKLN